MGDTWVRPSIGRSWGAQRGCCASGGAPFLRRKGGKRALGQSPWTPGKGRDTPPGESFLSRGFGSVVGAWAMARHRLARGDVGGFRGGKGGRRRGWGPGRLYIAEKETTPGRSRGRERNSMEINPGQRSGRSRRRCAYTPRSKHRSRPRCGRRRSCGSPGSSGEWLPPRSWG